MVRGWFGKGKENMGIVVHRGDRLETAFDRVPRIVLDPERRRDIGLAMVKTLVDHGVLALVVSDEDASMIRDLHQSVAHFFAGSVEEKRRASDIENEAAYREWAHSRSYAGFPELDESVLRMAGVPLPGSEYDEELAKLDDGFERFRHFGEGVMDILLDGLRCHFDSDSEIDFAPYSAVQTNSYAKPTQAQIDKAAADMKDLVAKRKLEVMTVEAVVNAEESQGLHDDEDIATIGAPATDPGLMLEIEGSEGQLFVPARLKPNEVILMPSRGLYMLTGGVIKGLRHKVLNRLRDSIDRRSIQYFINFPSEAGTVKPFHANEINEGIDIGSEAAERAQKAFDSNPSLFVDKRLTS